MYKKSQENTKPQEQSPQVFFKTIVFNDGTQIELNHNSILVFTGANNSGKSQVLKDAERYTDKSVLLPTIVIKNMETEFLGSINEAKFFDENFFKNNQGYYQLYGGSDYYREESLCNQWRRKELDSETHKMFIKHLSTEIRLTVSNELYRQGAPRNHPIYKLSKNEMLAQKLSMYFNQAFGIDLVVNSNEMETIPLHVGKAPDKKAFTMDRQDEYYKQLSQLPHLHEQGDGMRSFASILLDTFTSDHTITLIDEPEAFLHPPQARMLGKMLAKNNQNDHQLLLSTHSEDFLQGLLDVDNENVTVIRINRTNNINKMSVLPNDEIKKLWSNPILRYSNILSGLFHEKVVVCESDYDCLFYQAIVNAMYEQKGEYSPDILFTHCGGKARAKDIVASLKAVNVPVVAICDFDLIDESQYFKPIVSSFGIDWNKELAKDMKTIYDSMNAKSGSGTDAWKAIKKVGKAGFTGDEPAAYEKVESVCKAAGLFVVPVGEMECFDKTINKEKKDWVYYVLENYNLATEPKLENARRFVQEIVDYKLIEQ